MASMRGRCSGPHDRWECTRLRKRHKAIDEAPKEGSWRMTYEEVLALPASVRDADAMDLDAAGWGSVSRSRIPEDWRTRPGPDKSKVHREAIRQGRTPRVLGKYAKRLEGLR